MVGAFATVEEATRAHDVALIKAGQLTHVIVPRTLARAYTDTLALTR